MNNKAFTLVELVAIILILALIALIAFPALIGTQKSDSEKLYTNMVNDLCLAGETYIYSNKDDFDLSIENEIEIDIQELIAYGNIDSNLKNPNTNNTIVDDTLKYTVQSDKALSCEYIDNE